MCQQQGIRPGAVEASHFDPPHGGTGGLFPISRGILQAAGIDEDLMNGEVVSTQGRAHMIEAIKEFSDGDLGARLLEALCCEGCIMGAGINNELPLFNRRRHVRVHVNRRMAALDRGQWQAEMDRFDDLDLRRTFRASDQRIPLPAPEELAEIMAGMGKFSPDDELNCGACGYDTCREHAVAIYKGLAENEMCLPFMIGQLQCALADIEASNRELARTQEALMQSEKMASMGQLAAGIAHEVNNPLGVVLMYAHLLLDECQDPKIRDDLKMITEQADRCKKIVAGLLHFARQHKVVRQPVDLRTLVDRTLNATRAPDDVFIDVRHDLEDPIVEVDGDQIIQVLTNLVSNALAAMEHGGRLTIRTSGDAQRVSVQVSDTGVGIPRQNVAKIFEPFFTTKESGKGTGLGLAVSYGIIKMHCGDIRVDSQPDAAVGPTWTAFTVTLPRRE
jgi:signal transduction histidine kinase